MLVYVCSISKPLFYLLKFLGSFRSALPKFINKSGEISPVRLLNDSCSNLLSFEIFSHLRLLSKLYEPQISTLYYTPTRAQMQCYFIFLIADKNVNIKFDIFSCFYRFAVLHNTQPVLLYIFTFRQRNSKAATAASLSRSLFPFLCKLLYLFLE